VTRGRWIVVAFAAGAIVAALRPRPTPPAVAQAGLTPEGPELAAARA
jgi:hypothetical protein